MRSSSSSPFDHGRSPRVDPSRDPCSVPRTGPRASTTPGTPLDEPLRDSAYRRKFQLSVTDVADFVTERCQEAICEASGAWPPSSSPSAPACPSGSPTSSAASSRAGTRVVVWSCPRRRARGDRVLVALRGDGPPDAIFVPYALASSVLGVVGLTALYRGLATGMMSVVAPIAASAAVVAVARRGVTGETAGRRSRTSGSRSRSAGSSSSRSRRAKGSERTRPRGGRGARVRRGGLLRAFLVLFDRAAIGRSLLGDARAAHRLGLAAARRPRRRAPSKPFAFGAATLLLLMSVGLLDVAGNAFFAVASTKGARRRRLGALVALPGRDGRARAHRARGTAHEAPGRGRGVRLRRRGADRARLAERSDEHAPRARAVELAEEDPLPGAEREVAVRAPG